MGALLSYPMAVKRSIFQNWFLTCFEHVGSKGERNVLVILRLVALAMFCLVAASGCGGGPKLPPRYQVTGTFIYNGEPVEGARVTFTPTEDTAHVGNATTDAQGKYTIKAIEGPHKVTIEKGSSAEDTPRSDDNLLSAPPPPKHLLPAKYIFTETTDLQADVKPSGENVFDFELIGSPGGAVSGPSEVENDTMPQTIDPRFP